VFQEAVRIRPYQASDAPLLLDAAIESREHLSPWLPWCHAEYNRSDSETWIRHCAEMQITRSEYHFVITDPDGRFLGGCGLNQIRADHGIANLGYWVRASATGRGVATEAVRLLAEFAFRETDLRRLEIVAAVTNLASRRVAEKAGALWEGVQRDRLMLQGRSHDAVVYALVRSNTGTTRGSHSREHGTPAPPVERLPLPPGAADLEALARLLVDTVESGAAVSFLAPIDVEAARDWWTRTLATAHPRAIFLVARDDEGICGAVQLHPAWAPNQPHRGDIVKLMVHRRARGTGRGTQLMEAIELAAREAGYRLLTLDTRRGDAAERLYRRMGWTELGTIPRYALDPDGTPHDAVFFWKEIG
jgi:RimJ/RimL family protein N-acetyltransferase